MSHTLPLMLALIIGTTCGQFLVEWRKQSPRYSQACERAWFTAIGALLAWVVLTQ